MKHNYSLIVSNVGTTWQGSDGAQALREFGQAKRSAAQPGGRDGFESVTLFRDGEPYREFEPGPFWFFECTDTYGGETNYCWVHRFKVLAPTMRGALRKVSRELGYVGRLNYVGADRWDIRGAAVCIMGEYWDDDSHSNYLHVKGL